MVGGHQRATGHRDVLDALDLDPEPVAVVEVEHRLHQLEHALRAAPVVDLALGVGWGDQPGQLAQRGRLRRGSAPGQPVDVGVVVVRRSPGRAAPRRRPRPPAGPPSSGLSALSVRLCSLWVARRPSTGGDSVRAPQPGRTGCQAVLTGGRREARRRWRRRPRRRRRRCRRPRPPAAGSRARSGPARGDVTLEVSRPDLPVAAITGSPGWNGGGQPQAAQVPVGAAAVVHAGDGLLPDVAALREAHRALDDAGLPGQVVRAHVDAVARDPELDPQDLGRLVADALGARLQQRFAQGAGALRRGQQVDAGAGGDDPDGLIAHACIDPVVFGGRDRDGGHAACDLGRRGPEQRQDRALGRAVGDLDLAPDLVHAQVLQHRVERVAARCRATAPPGRPRGSACRPGCGPSGPAARRSSPDPAPASRTSFVTWPWRNSAASGPVTSSLPRAERSSRPAPSVSGRVVALELQVASRWSWH